MSTKKFNNLKNATGTIIKRAREDIPIRGIMLTMGAMLI